MAYELNHSDEAAADAEAAEKQMKQQIKRNEDLMNRRRTVKRMIDILLCAVLLAAVCYSAVGIYVYNASVHSVNQERRPLSCKQESLEKKGFDVTGFETKYHRQTVMIPSSFGDYKIPAYYFSPDGARERDTVVLAHGLNGNRLTGYPVAEMFLRHGYNVMTYDQRASGESEAEYMTCGYWESRDFADCVDYVRENAGEDRRIGAWGSSIGGATVGFYLGTKDAQQLSFAVLDCPVSDMAEIIDCFLTRKNDWIPAALRISAGSTVTKLKLGYDYTDGNVCDYVADTTVPVLIFHTKKDRVTPYHMGTDLYEAMHANRKKEISIEDSGHTDIYFDHPEFYEKEMFRFISGE